MDKRRFITRAGLGAALWPATRAVAAPDQGPVLLTVSGALARGNRGPLDPVLDQMMRRHGAQFERAWTFDAAALRRLPTVTMRPTLEYDARVHTLEGPLLETVLRAAGAGDGDAQVLGLRALDGYQVRLGRADTRRRRMIVALRIDGRPLALGGLGPQWALHDADRLPEFSDKPLKERFAPCPWGLYHIDVAAA